MLKSISIKGFRGLRDIKLDLAQSKPTVLIGENGSGKSTILDALAVLVALVQGTGGDAIHDRGGWDAIRWAPSAMPIEFDLEFARGTRFFTKEKGSVRYNVSLEVERGVPSVVREQLRVIKDARPDDAGVVVLQGGPRAFAKDVRNGTDMTIEMPRESRLHRNTTISAITEADGNRFPTVVELRRALRDVVTYAGFPSLLRDDHASLPSTSPVEAVPRVERSGKNLIASLYALRENHPNVWRELLRDVDAVFPWCKDVQFPPAASARGALTLRWRDARIGAQLYLDDMSDGMRVYFATLAALHAQDEVSVLAFDEPERSQHPRALRRLVSVLEARSLRTPILIATHSDRLLGFLEDPAEVLRITRFDKKEGVTIEPLPKDLVNEWLREFSVVELRERNLLDGPREEQ